MFIDIGMTWVFKKPVLSGTHYKPLFISKTKFRGERRTSSTDNRHGVISIYKYI